MKILIAILFIISCFSIESCSKGDEELLPFADTMPQFPGGPSEMYKFIYTEIKYPQQAKDNGICGTVVIKFYVDKAGFLRDIHIVDGPGYGLDEEALRVVTLMNKDHRWRPAVHEGKLVRVEFTLPIKFVLQHMNC